MEYLLGSLITLITMSVVARLVKSPQNNPKRVRTNFSQSRQYKLISDYIPIKPKKLKTQSTKHYQKQHTRVVFIGDTAYWIEKNGLHKAQFVDGKINEETKVKVDTMGMDRVELDKMIFIVDRLTEGLTDDSGNSGH